MIEHKGIEWVGDSERHGNPRILFWAWAAPNINLFCAVFGMYVAALGLGWIPAAIAATVGAVLSFLLVGLAAPAGNLGGAPILITSRAAFGFNGNIVPTLLSYLSHIGWETVNAVLATLAAKTVAQRLGLATAPVMVTTFAFMLIATTVVSVYGLQLVLRVQKALTIIFAALTVMYLVLTVPELSFAAPGHWSWGAMAGGIALSASALGLGWVNCASDYSRYLPRQSSTRAIIGWTTVGASALPIVLMIFGILLATGDPTITKAAELNPVGALSTHLPTWFLIPYLIFVVLSFTSASVMDLYSSGLNLLTMGVRLSRPAAALIDAVLVALFGAYVTFAAPNFFAPFQAFLTGMAVPMAAWAGIFLVDLWQRRHIGYDCIALYAPTGSYGRVNRAGVGMLLLATAIGLGLVTSTDPHISPLLGYLFTPAAKAGTVGAANPGVFVALVLGAAGYGVLHRTARRSVAVDEPAPVIPQPAH